MNDEQKIARLTDVIASLQEEINLHTRARVVEDRERSEAKAKVESLCEELEAWNHENKRLRASITRLERDLRLAQRMATKRGKR